MSTPRPCLRTEESSNASVTESASRAGGGPAPLVNKLDSGSAWETT